MGGMTKKEMAAIIARKGADSPGAAFDKRFPKKAAKALEMVAEGVPWKKVAREVGMDYGTLVALKRKYVTTVEERKAALAEDALDIAEGLRLLQKQKMEMLAEDPEQLARTNIRDLAIPWGIANDKYLQAVGEQKVVVEHKSGKPSLEDAMKAIEEARAALRAKAIDVPEVTVEPKEAEKV